MCAAKPKWGGAPSEKCVKCGNTVYAAEMTKMENQIWHIECLRCVECNKKLAGANWGGFVPPNNSPYCSVHHKRLLQSAGSAIEFSGSTTDSKWNIRVATEGAQGYGGSGSPASEKKSESSSEESRDDGESHNSEDSSSSSAPAPVEKKSTPAPASTSSSSGSSASSGSGVRKWGGAPSEKCVKCGKTVYSAEMAKMENQIWHDNCLRCVEEGCNKKLSGANWGGFVPPNNAPYCSVHHKRLLQAAGSSVGFSGSTTNSKWNIAKD